MLTSTLLLAAMAHAADVKVTHLGHYRIYRMSAGETVEDTWPTIATSTARRAKGSVVTVKLHLTEVDGLLELEARVEEHVGGKLVDYLYPTIGTVDPEVPYAHFEMHHRTAEGLYLATSRVEIMAEGDPGVVVEP